MRPDQSARGGPARPYAWTPSSEERTSAFELVAELIHRPYRWWALLAVALFVVGGTTLPGFLPLLPGFLLATVVCSLAASRIRERRRRARPPDSGY